MFVKCSTGATLINEFFANYRSYSFIISELIFRIWKQIALLWIVNNPDFENGIVKIQQGGRLSRAEEDAVKMFKKAPVNEADVTVSHADKYKLQIIFLQSTF